MGSLNHVNNSSTDESLCQVHNPAEFSMHEALSLDSRALHGYPTLQADTCSEEKPAWSSTAMSVPETSGRRLDC